MAETLKVVAEPKVVAGPKVVAEALKVVAEPIIVAHSAWVVVRGTPMGCIPNCDSAPLDTSLGRGMWAVGIFPRDGS